jgi:hypothetical protein
VLLIVFGKTNCRMNNEINSLEDIKAIRKIMEESTRFLSLSGLSGVLAGVAALAGALIAWLFIDDKWSLMVVAAAVLVLSLSVAFWLSVKKAKREGKHFWTPVSRKMLVHLFIPLVTGGILALVFLCQGNMQLIVPVFLIFYGLALVNAAKYTLGEIFYLGILEIITGLVLTIFPGWWLIGWSFGFGILHVVYGLVMYVKYGR